MKSLRIPGFFLLIWWVGSATAQPIQWEFRAPLNVARAGIAATVLDGQIYVLGGQDRLGAVLDVAARYDPQTNQWVSLPPLGKARVNAAAVTFEGRVYVLGGRDKNGKVLKDVEYFDPAENRWQSFESMAEEREGLTATIRNNKLYVAGGSNDKEEILGSIEFFEEGAGVWIEFDGENDNPEEEDAGEEVEFTSAIEALTGTSITVSGMTFAVTDTTEILDANNNPITLGDLAVGMLVQVHGRLFSDGTLIATRIRVEDEGGLEIEGAVEALSSTSITVAGTTFEVNGVTEVLDEDNNPISYNDLAVGMIVDVRGEQQAGGALLANRIRIRDRGDGGGLGELAFCQSGIDLNTGDTFNIRDYVQLAGSTGTIDWTQVFFTYTEAGANDPTNPPDWNLAAFNAGQPVTVNIEDADAGTGNRGGGEYRVYIVRQGQPVYDDHVTFRIDDDRTSEVESARCNGVAASKRTSSGLLGTPRASFSAVQVGDSVLFIGGFSQFGPLDLVQRLRPNGNFDFLTPLPVSRGSLAAAARHDTIYVIGGRDANDQVLTNVHMLVPGADQWVQQPPLNVARELAAAVAVDGVVYVIGGRSASGRVLDSIEAFGHRSTGRERPDLPPDFHLEQNYPNPFRAATTIAFSVSSQASSQRVLVEVYDLQGRRLVQLINGVLAPGLHEITWDGTDRGGRSLGSGLYFYRLQQGDFVARNTMIIIH